MYNHLPANNEFTEYFRDVLKLTTTTGYIYGQAFSAKIGDTTSNIMSLNKPAYLASTFYSRLTPGTEMYTISKYMEKNSLNGNVNIIKLISNHCL